MTYGARLNVFNEAMNAFQVLQIMEFYSICFDY